MSVKEELAAGMEEEKEQQPAIGAKERGATNAPEPLPKQRQRGKKRLPKGRAIGAMGQGVKFAQRQGVVETMMISVEVEVGGVTSAVVKGVSTAQIPKWN